LEVRLIYRNNNFIGQILEIFEDKRKNRKKEKYSVKGIADEQKYSRGVKKKSSELTSGTVKLMAMFSQGRRSKTGEIGGEGLR